MTYIPRRDITDLIPNKFEAIRVLALECRRLNEEIRAREDTEVEGKLTTLAVKQMLEGKVTYYDAKERREQERSEAMLSAAEGLLDIAEPMMEPDFDAPMTDDAAPVEGEAPVEGATDADAPATDASTDEAVTAEAVVEETVADEAPVIEEVVAVEVPVEEAAAAEEAPVVVEAIAEEPVEEPVEVPVVEEAAAVAADESDDAEKEKPEA